MRILKILGKSALCFAGLVIASWLEQTICDWMLSWGNIYLPIFVMLKCTILSFTLRFLLTIAYTFILSRLFANDPHRYLIIALNGLFILVLVFVLWLLRVDTSCISYLDLRMVQVDSISVIALALTFKLISVERKVLNKVNKRIANVIFILMKSSACMGLLVVFAWAGYAFLDLRIPWVSFITPFQSFSFIDLLAVIVYAGALYMLLRRYKHTF